MGMGEARKRRNCHEHGSKTSAAEGPGMYHGANTELGRSRTVFAGCSAKAPRPHAQDGLPCRRRVGAGVVVVEGSAHRAGILRWCRRYRGLTKGPTWSPRRRGAKREGVGV